MSVVTARTIMAAAAQRLRDTGFTFWSENLLFSLVSEAEREIVSFKPDAWTARAIIELAPGTTQDCGGSFLQRVICNRASLTGAVVGEAPLQSDEAALDLRQPSWRTTPPSALVRAWMHDPRTPAKFEIWPPQPDPATGYLEVLRGETPPALEATSGGDIYDVSCNLDLRYANAMTTYVWSQAMAMETAADAIARAAQIYQLFITMLQAGESSEASTTGAAVPSYPQQSTSKR